jgi:hypothetical protein
MSFESFSSFFRLGQKKRSALHHDTRMYDVRCDVQDETEELIAKPTSFYLNVNTRT